ncbi:MAG: diaminopimelate decarboxylase [Bacillota bacterium]|nr:diaminopimelate decarboxylase [Bacillota bacterium]
MEILQIGGVSCRKLADEFGTPLNVYDENKIRYQAESAVRGFSSEKFETEVVYASKAFSSIALFRMLGEEGIGFDVVSGGELYGVIQAGGDMSKVYFHGNNKSNEEMEMALDAGVGYFVVDNVMEASRLADIADRKQRSTKALLRINPGISAHTHEYIMTAAPDSKFGIHIKDRKHIEEVIQKLSRSRYVKLSGFHSHIGSQIVEAESFEKALETMIGFLAGMKADMGLDNMELSIGGGFGIRYLDTDKPVELGDMCSRMVAAAERYTEEKGVSISKLITEPGRSMVGEAGCTLYTIGDMKTSGDKNYIFVDGGMSDNIRPALYDAEYTAVLAEKPDAVGETTYCVAGKNCESGDVLIRQIRLPKAETGDLLVMKATGAYGYSMASNYNRLGRPAVVFAADGNARLVIRRETYEDQYKLEV